MGVKKQGGQPFDFKDFMPFPIDDTPQEPATAQQVMAFLTMKTKKKD